MAQSLISPRATAIAAYGPLVSNSREFGWNPAGLTGLRDWEFSATTYLPTSGSFDGFVFHGLTLGKRFLDRHAAAMQFSNGTVLEAVFSTDGIIVGPEPTTVDSRMAYNEKFSLAYAYRIPPDLSAGVLGRLRQAIPGEGGTRKARALVRQLREFVREREVRPV